MSKPYQLSPDPNMMFWRNADKRLSVWHNDDKTLSVVLTLIQALD